MRAGLASVLGNGARRRRAATALMLFVHAVTALAAGPDLPEWKGGPGPDGYVLGGGLWPVDGAVAAAENAKESAAPAAAAMTVSAGADPVAAPRPPAAPGLPSLVLEDPATPPPPPAGEGGLRPVLGMRVPLPMLMPLPDAETFAHELPPVTGELRDEYFSLRPVEFLVDPQRLLTEQKSHDVQRFLEYHADEAQYDVYLLLFGPNQEIPGDVSLEERHRQWFGDEPAVLVAYFLEHPEKTRVIYGESVKSRLPSVVFDRIFQSCVREAQVAATAFDQVERLAIELSIRLYWMAKLAERQLAGEVIATTQEELTEPNWSEIAGQAQSAVILESDSRASRIAARLLQLPWLWMGLGTFAASCLLGGGAWWWRRDSLAARPVLFPDLDLPSRLGGAHSGGGYVGISFEVSGKSEG